MTLKEYLASFDRDTAAQREFASRCGTSLEYLRQVANGHRRVSTQLAITIERETGGTVMCEDLLPGIDWAYLRDSSAQREAS